jgi:hypothetical protein
MRNFRALAAYTLAFLAAGAVWLAAELAFAQAGSLPLPTTAPVVVTASAPSTVIDLTQIAIALLPFVFGALVVVLQIFLPKLLAALHVQNATGLSAEFLSQMQLALAWGQQKLGTKIAATGLTVDTHNQLVALAGSWLADHAAQSIEAQKLTTQQVEQKLEALIALNTTPPEQSVALPTPAKAS